MKPNSEERQCAMRAKCEHMFIDHNTPFIAPKFDPLPFQTAIPGWSSLSILEEDPSAPLLRRAVQ